MQPRRSAPKEGDNVMAARDPGRVTAILYSRLATILRSLAIILLYIYTYYHSHPRLQPYSNNYQTYAYEAERWRTSPYTILSSYPLMLTASRDQGLILPTLRISCGARRRCAVVVRQFTKICRNMPSTVDLTSKQLLG